MRESEKVRVRILVRMGEMLIGFYFWQKTTNGVIWYILGVIFVLWVFPLDIAVVAVLM
jgi:diacylglycerol kinase (CTP)